MSKFVKYVIDKEAFADQIGSDAVIVNVKHTFNEVEITLLTVDNIEEKEYKVVREQIFLTDNNVKITYND